MTGSVMLEQTQTGSSHTSAETQEMEKEVDIQEVVLEVVADRKYHRK